MRTMTTATMTLVATVMMAQAAVAGLAFPDGRRPDPRPVSSHALLGTTFGIRSRATLQTVRIEKLATAGIRDAIATVPFLVEPRIMTGSDHRAQLSMNGEPMAERRIASGSAIVIDAAVPADGEVHAVCVSVQRMTAGGGSVQAARRCFDVVVPVSGQF